ncbi:thioester domain-containing protein [Glycomyces sp. TRM65418]|uniref:thioester domain-containing protein n=1 Tax=Glycomyces sp. TRM65418 TaxID=2867006 RepID=UPI001CE57960|nr:thioester domain-containing protein [Glycomyces sp. TRM65418]MCC3763725.1 thioester domain-containing protein [Glycomyces sp. TRM65418]QZD53438.1 thioester domain-containing protein [Glycomyces sp. TRM65418]
MMTKALKGTLAAAAGVALSLTGVAGAQAQEEEGPSIAATGGVVLEPGIWLNGESKSLEATMIGLDLGDGETRTVYCIQIHVDLEEDLAHEERPWEDVPVEQLPKVLGVLVNGFDGTNAAELIEAAGVSGEDIDPFTQDQVAYAGTQAAIWSLTDGWKANAADATEGEAGVDTAVNTIREYLITESEPVDEPDFEPYFEIDDAEATTEGALVGPFTVATNFDALSFSQPEGASIVDENGEEVSSFTDGQTFYVEFDEAKSGSVTLTTDSITWTTPAGRTFVPVDAEGADVEGQRLILAEEYTSEYAAEVEFEIAVEEVPPASESPKPQLPVTGASLTTVASVGAAVLLAGVGAMVLMRRRAARADWGSDA